jgi:hypothetical protein
MTGIRLWTGPCLPSRAQPAVPSPACLSRRAQPGLPIPPCPARRA